MSLVGVQRRGGSAPRAGGRLASGENLGSRGAGTLLGCGLRGAQKPLARLAFRGRADISLCSKPVAKRRLYLAIALGREAIGAAYSVLFVTAPVLAAALAKAHAEGGLEERLSFYAKPKLLIIDELGDLRFAPDAAHLFFQHVSRRYERGSLLITSTPPVCEWGTVFTDPVMATPILDRLPHHSHVVTIRGGSYRPREKHRGGLIKSRPLNLKSPG